MRNYLVARQTRAQVLRNIARKTRTRSGGTVPANSVLSNGFNTVGPYGPECPRSIDRSHVGTCAGFSALLKDLCSPTVMLAASHQLGNFTTSTQPRETPPTVSGMRRLPRRYLARRRWRADAREV